MAGSESRLSGEATSAQVVVEEFRHEHSELVSRLLESTRANRALVVMCRKLKDALLEQTHAAEFARDQQQKDGDMIAELRRRLAVAEQEVETSRLREAAAQSLVQTLRLKTKQLEELVVVHGGSSPAGLGD